MTNSHLAKRIAEEKKIVTLTVETLIAAGFAVCADNGENETPISRSADVALSEAFDTDSVRIRVWDVNPATPKTFNGAGWVFFVFGNEAHEVINDYTTSLETVLAPVLAYCEELEANN